MAIWLISLAAGSCPAGWTPAPANTSFSDRCYYSTERVWSLRECVDKCAPHGAPACIHSKEEMDFVLSAISAPLQLEGNLKMTAYLVPGHFLGLYQPTPLKAHLTGNDLVGDDYSKCVDGSTPGYYDWANMSDALAPQPSRRGGSGHEGNLDCVRLMDDLPQDTGAWSVVPVERRQWESSACDEYGIWRPMPCLCASPGVATADALAFLDEWNEADLARRREVLYDVIPTVVGVALLYPTIFFLVIEIIRCVRRRRNAKGSTDGVQSERSKMLRNAQRVSTSRRRKIQMMLVYLGWACLVVGALLGGNASGPGEAFDPLIGPFNAWLCINIGVGLPLILLSILPTDVVAIRVAAGFMMLFNGLQGYQFIIQALEAAFLGDWLMPATYGTVGLLLAGSFVSLIPAVSGCTCCVCCVKFGLAPRAALRRVWLSLRIWLIGFSVAIFMIPAAFLGIYPNVFFESPISTYCIVHLIHWWLVAIFATPRNRGLVNKWINRLVATRTKGDNVEEEAAVVAALVGGGSAESALEEGAARFRALPLCILSEADLQSSGDSGLHAKTMPVQLGDVHGFVSHSWSDDGAAKYEQLKKVWAGREDPESVMIWLDKACIDQQNIVKSLSALPVFLSGCKELVVLLGPSYASRLWYAAACPRGR